MIEAHRSYVERSDENGRCPAEVLALTPFHRFCALCRYHYVTTIWRARTILARSVKRIFDILLALGALILCAPIMTLTALAIRLDSPGPVLFRQTRVGKWGKPFTCYKFRSMYIDAEQRLAEFMVYNEV